MNNTLVMIVDDERGLLQLFGSLIERQGYKVIEASGGEAAIEILHNATPDLLVLDLAMPKISGRDVLSYIKDTPRLDNMKVIVLTALGPGTIKDGALERTDKWINKPVRPDVFIKQIQEMLEND